MSVVVAYLLGLSTAPVAFGALLLWLRLYALVESFGWTSHLTIYDDADDWHIITRSRSSLGPLHIGRRTWWNQKPYPDLDIEGDRREARWFGVGRFGGRGLSVAKGRRVQ